MPPNRKYSSPFAVLILTLAIAALGCSFIRIELFAGCRNEQSTTQMANRELKATLTIDHFCYSGDEPVRLQLSLTNITDSPLLLERGNERSIVELMIVGHEGQGSYYWDKASGPSQTLDKLDLDPGESFEINWSVFPSGHGNFTATASIYQQDFEMISLDQGFQLSKEGKNSID